MSTADSVKVFGPATVANVSCGFDILGFALDEPGDIVTAHKTDSSGLSFSCLQAKALGIPVDSELNTASAPAAKLLKDLGYRGGVHLELQKNMPIGSGLGSSAASAAAALVAVNRLLDSPLSREELVPYAVEAERIACGAAHADNVAPAIVGGFVLIRSSDPLDIVSLPCPENLHCSVVHPHIVLETRHSRDILKKSIPLRSAVTQWGNTAALVAALFMNDLQLLGRSLQDVVIEPERSQILPGFEKARSAALGCGALGFGISGSGPSLFALSESEAIANLAASKITEVFQDLRIQSEAFVGRVNAEGAKIVEDQH